MNERFVSREEFNDIIADEAAQSCVDWNDPERRKEALRYIVKQIWNEAINEQQPAPPSLSTEQVPAEWLKATADAIGDIMDGIGRYDQPNFPWILPLLRSQLEALLGVVKLTHDGAEWDRGFKAGLGQAARELKQLELKEGK